MNDHPVWMSGPLNTLTRFGEIPLFREGLYSIAPDTYAWMVPNGSWGETNIGLIDCGGESVLIDTCWDLAFTQEMLQHFHGVLKNSPIEYVINTHGDGDHCWGNQLFANTPIIATNACIHSMHHYSPKSLTALTHAGRVLKRLPLGSVRKFAHYMSSMFAPYDFSDVQITPPTEGFNGQKCINVRGVDIVINEVGPGHTDGDAIVYVPDRKVAYAGDILFIGATPVMWAGPVKNICDALKQLLAFDATVIVPGHGAFAQPKDVQNLLDYWEYLQEHLFAQSNNGMSSIEAARYIALSDDFNQRPFAHWDSPERIITNAWNLYREWGIDQTSLPSTLGTMNLLRHQATLAFDLNKASPRVMRHF